MARLPSPIKEQMFDRFGKITRTWRRYIEQFLDIEDADTWFGTKDLADLGTKNHDDLDNKAWSVAGHTIDENVDFATNKAINLADGVDSADSVNFRQLKEVEGISTAISADYTVLDDDGYGLIKVTTGSSDITITFPTAADNLDREIAVHKADSGTGNVIQDGEGSEELDYELTQTIYNQGETMTWKCDGTGWVIK